MTGPVRGSDVQMTDRWRLHRRRVRVVQMMIGLLVGLAALAGLAAPASADGEAIRVQVKDQQRTADGKTDNQPVPGVTVTVVDATGAEVGSGVTDDKGVVVIPVPGKADYTVRIDESTLPDGKALSEQTPAEQPIAADSFITATRTVNFFTGESQRTETGTAERWLQRLSDGTRP